jgi:hypothetical protein
MNGAIIECGIAQPLHSLGADRTRISRQGVGVLTERDVRGLEVGRTPVARDPFNEGIRRRGIRDPEIGDLGPEVVRVRANSIVAPVGARHDDRQQFPLSPRQR